MYIHDPSTAKHAAVGVAAADVATGLDTTQVYAFVANTDCYIAQGATPAASAADGSALVPAGTIVYLHGRNGAVVNAIRVTADGVATLTRVGNR